MLSINIFNKEKVKVYKKNENYVSVEFKENNYLIKNLDSKEEIETFYRLRYNIYFLELSWVDSKRKKNKEIDEYDKRSVFFGIFHNNKLIGGVRLIFSDDFNKTMAYRTFNFKLSESKKSENRNKFLEISRLGILKEYRKKKIPGSEIKIVYCLYKALNQWILRNGFRYVYMVIDKKYFENLLQFFEIKQKQSHKENILAEIDFLKSQNKLKSINSSLYKWFMEDLI
jgi:N-acyl-L-homoserine lactone synthetase